MHKLSLDGRFNFQLFDACNNPLTEELVAKNGVTIDAKIRLLRRFFAASGADVPLNWFVGAINEVGMVILSQNDTMANHPGWTEFTNYTINSNATNRATWNQSISANGQLQNNLQIEFVFTASGVINGVFVCTEALKSSFSPGEILWSTASFEAPLIIGTGDKLKMTYTVSS